MFAFDLRYERVNFWNIIVNVLFSIVTGALYGYAICRNFVELKFLNHIFYTSIFQATTISVKLAFAASGSTLMLTALYYFHYKNYRLYRKQTSNLFNKAALPILIYSLYLFNFKQGFWEPILFTIVTAWWAYRLLLLTPIKIEKKISSNFIWYTIGLMMIFFIGYGFLQQKKAHEILYLTYYDWGIFLGIAKNNLAGKWFITNQIIPPSNFLGDHFAPGSILFITAYVALFYSINAFFLLNSIILYSMAPLTYWLARVNNISKKNSLILFVAAILSPSLMCLNLTSFHGFHLISLMIPALLLFFIALSSGRFKTAFIIFLLSLTIKETVPIVWLGLGSILFFTGKRKLGILIFIISLCYWLLVVFLIIPAFSNGSSYMYVIRYGHLGNSIGEIAMSPFLKPMAFFGSMFRLDCIYFILLLILPFLPLVAGRPYWFIGSLPTLAFVCLQQSNRFQNITTQYQIEAMILACVCAVMAAKELSSGKNNLFFTSILSLGIKRLAQQRPDRVLTAAMTSLLTVAVLSNFFFAQSDWSKYSFAGMRQCKDWSKEIMELKKLIPENVKLNASRHLATHFILRNELYPSFSKLYDYVLLDLDDPYDIAQDVAKARKELLHSDKYDLVYNKAFTGSHIMLFVPAKKEKLNKKNSNVIQMSLQQWQNSGDIINIPNTKSVAVKAALQKIGSQPMVRLFVKIVTPVEHDIKIKAQISNGKEYFYYANRFGNGIEPAYSVKPGSTYILDMPVPDSWEKVRSCKVKILTAK